ncbi:MAG: PDZ domain-containing protein, partial [Ginsengibacter sp.]
MKKNILLGVILIAGITLSSQSQAQEKAPKEKKTEEIIIRKNGNKDNKMTIQVDGDSITVNGKPLSEYHDGDVTVMERGLRSRGSNNFLYTPGNGSGDFNWFQNDDENAASHAFLGVLTDKSDDGVKITEVVKGSAAEKAGLLKGDVISKLEDKVITSPEDLMDAVRSHKTGDEVKVYYSRDSKKKDVKVKLGETKGNNRTFIYKNTNPEWRGNDFNFKMPPMPKMNNNFFKFRYNNDRPKLGVKIEDTENSTGVKVLSVEEGSPADKAGLKKDDIITSLNGEKVNSVDEVMDKINDSGDAATFNIKALRNNSEMSFEVKTPKKLNSAD